MNSWKTLLKLGNKAFDTQSYFDAQIHYENAIHVIEGTWGTQHDNPELLFGWVAAMHNMAELFEQQKMESRALFVLRSTHEQVLAFVNDLSQTEEMQTMALRASSMTMGRLMLFAKDHKLCKKCIKNLSQPSVPQYQPQAYFH